MTMTVADLEEYGTTLRPVSNAPFLVEDEESVWIVESGKLDLFLVDVKGNEPVGARYHVMRVESPHAVFGLGVHAEGVAMMATAAPETRLLRIGRQSMAHKLGANDASIAAQLTEEWISHLSAAISESMAPNPMVMLEPSLTVTIAEESKAIVPKHGILWVEHLKGNSYFLADNQLPPVNGSGFFPINKHSWLQASPGSVISSANTLSIFQRDEEWKGLRNFHALALPALLANRERAARQEKRRLEARAAADSARVDNALLRLLTPLGLAQPADSGPPSNDPLLLAAQAVGHRLGLNIKAHPDMLRGAAVVDPIAAIAKASGVRIRRVALKGLWWKQENGPLLAFIDEEKRPVALLPKSANRYEIYEPLERRTRPLDPDAIAALDPFAYAIYRPFPVKKLSLADVLKFGLHGCKSELWTILAAGAAAGLMGVLTPFATAIVFDELIPGAERTQLTEMMLILFIVAIVTAMFTLARSFAMLRLEGKLDASLQAAVWDRLLSLPVPFFREFTSGDLALRSLGIAQIRETLTGPTLTAILSAVFSSFSFLLLFYYSWKLALLATLLVAVSFLLSSLCGFLQVRWQRKIFNVRGAISGALLQFVTGIAKFRVSGTEARAFAAWARDFAQQKQLANRSRGLGNALVVFNSVFPVVSLMCLFLYHSYLISQPNENQITTGEFLAFLAAFIQFQAASLLVSSSIMTVLGIVPLYERTRPIFYALPEVNEAKASPGVLTGTIEISHVTFRYKPDTPIVLRDISVSIYPGQFVAFVGASGSGKSTVFRLLLGFERPESGAIYYDGQDLSGLDIQEVRRQTGVVLQTSRPVSGDIFTNIVGSAPLRLEDAWEAARMAGIDEDIHQMPMGMHTVISEGGGGISGGQRQRLMIARAIVGRPRILLFDEATSALDNRTQAIVSRSLESLQATRIVIAHRLSTIINADRIFVLDKGTIVQSGTYAELIKQPGLFQELAKRQLT
jgi:NHLM bacteriocin system ABC transporter ATP-binding protein